MKIVLSPDTQTLAPHWYAKWLILLLRLDLCHEIPITSIVGIIEMGNWLGYGKVELSFHTVEGQDQKILLYLKKHREFVDKATSAIRR